MKKVVGFILLIVSLMPVNIFAQRGCCSSHGGVSGACRNGYQVCNDGTTSPSCTCSSSSYSNQTYAPSYIYGCTDRNAINYNASANKDDGSCIAKISGCTNKDAINYNASANTDDNSCQFAKEITETEIIKYKTKYVENNEMVIGEEKTKTTGQNGEKQITYTVILDSSGKEISREKKSEVITKKAKDEIIEQGTNNGGIIIISILWIVCLIISFYYASKNKNGNLLLNKIQKQRKEESILLYILYVMMVIPAYIDVTIIIINKIKHK